MNTDESSLSSTPVSTPVESLSTSDPPSVQEAKGAIKKGEELKKAPSFKKTEQKADGKPNHTVQMVTDNAKLDIELSSELASLTRSLKRDNYKLSSKNSEQMTNLRASFKALRVEQNRLKAKIEKQEIALGKFNELTKKIKTKALQAGQKAMKSGSPSVKRSESRRLRRIAGAIQSQDLLRASRRLRY